MVIESESILDIWRINNRVATFLVENLPEQLWSASPSPDRQRTARAILAHVHNTRGMWARVLGGRLDIPAFRKVDPRTVTRSELVTSLDRSAASILALLRGGMDAGGRFPGVAGAFVFGALPRDVVTFLGYALSHESHHRGQVVSSARHAGHRLPDPTTAGLWQWSTRLREARARGGGSRVHGTGCCPDA
ncbi:MAG TPA: DinB family protein [Vicinamibacterales bacterium]